MCHADSNHANNTIVLFFRQQKISLACAELTSNPYTVKTDWLG